MTDPESPQSRIDALVRTAAAIEMELQATQEVWEQFAVERFGERGAAYYIKQMNARIAAKLANPDEGLSGRIH